MFDGCQNFNQNINRWDVSSGKKFSYMFDGCKNFNQDLSQWDVSKGELFNGMFFECKKFNQDLSYWNVFLGKEFSNIFKNTALNKETKKQIYLKWKLLNPDITWEKLYEQKTH